MKKYSLLMLPAIFLTVQCNSPKPVEKTEPVSEMSIKNQVQNGAFLVDVRTPEEFAEGSFEGAVNIPLDEVESRVDEFKGKKSVVVFCRSGKRSAQAIEILKNNGVEDITNGINVENMQKETK